MHIKTVSPVGKVDEMHVQDMGRKKNAFIFLNVLNQFDPFIHNDPIWQNEISTGAILATMYDSDFAITFANTSTSTI